MQLRESSHVSHLLAAEAIAYRHSTPSTHSSVWKKPACTRFKQIPVRRL